MIDRDKENEADLRRESVEWMFFVKPVAVYTGIDEVLWIKSITHLSEDEADDLYAYTTNLLEAGVFSHMAMVRESMKPFANLIQFVPKEVAETMVCKKTVEPKEALAVCERWRASFGEVEHADTSRKVIERIGGMSTFEARLALVEAGVIGEDGQLAEKYR